MNWQALLLLSSATIITGCTTLKSVRCGAPKYDTYLDFALDTISCGDNPKESTFISSTEHDRFFEDTQFTGGCLNGESLDRYFSRARGNGALLIIRNDTILLEKYFGSFSRLSPANIFSVSKAVTSLLCGIAVDEGRISVSAPITEYIPELETADSLFRQLTIEHLLDMRTGLDFKEDYSWNPFSKMAKLYYGKNIVRQFGELHFKELPGTSHYYNSMATALLGVAIERAVGIPFASYLEEKIWKPLGMEADAFISLDDKTHRQAKAYGGIATNVRDLAKIGRLYINGGICDGKRIVSQDWIDRSTHSTLDNEAYSRGWNNIITRIDEKDIVTPRFFALGLYGQVLFCDPEHNIIFVTLGDKKGCEYHLLFDDLCNLLQK